MLLLRSCAAFGLLVLGLFLADKRWLLFDLNSLAFILIPTLAAFASVKFGKEGFAVTRGLILQVSIVGILIAFVGMLARASDPSRIFGDAGGTALLVVLYACIVGGVCHLFSGNNEPQINSAPLPNRILALVVWILLTGFAMHSVAGIGAFSDASALTILLLLLESWPQCATWNLQAMDINTDVLATNVGKQHDVHSALHRFMQARPRGKIQQEGEQQKAPLSFLRFERRCHAPRKLTQKLRSHACCATSG